jgi:hypothetical protein
MKMWYFALDLFIFKNIFTQEWARNLFEFKLEKIQIFFILALKL